MGFFDKSSDSASASAGAQTSQTGADQSSNLNISGISSGKNQTVIINAADYGAINSALNFAGGAFGAAGDLAATTTKTALSFADHAASDNAALTGRVLDKQTTANLEFLGQVSNFADLSAQTIKDNAAFSERQAHDAITAVQQAQASALNMTNRLAQDTQTATLKALDYVFEATKSEAARLADNSLKWIIGAAVIVAIAPIFLKR